MTSESDLQEPQDFDVRASFVTIVDHLPCEVTRKLWLIQDLNQQYDKDRTELARRLQSLKQSRPPESVSIIDVPQSYKSQVDKIQNLRTKLHQLRLEALSQSRSLLETFSAAKRQVQEHRSQLKHELKLHQIQKAVREKRRKQALKAVNIKHIQQKEENTLDETETETRSKSQVASDKVTLKLKVPTRTDTVTKNSITKISLKPAQKRSSRKKKQEEEEETPEPTTDQAQERESDDESNIYCICQKSSSGDMIGCDNSKCHKQWFHFECVNVTVAPPDNRKWYCPDCCKRSHKSYRPEGFEDKKS